MNFDPGFDIQPIQSPPGFHYGPGSFGPPVENRGLDSIRRSLLDPGCTGPDPVYTIAMDVGRERDRADLLQRHLLFGVVMYAQGTLGREPVRSQGHVHKASPRNGWSTPEVYEIWEGRAIILMQESDDDDPGRCFAVEAGRGDVVIVPPGWAHATISADRRRPLIFGAWCDRDYGFIYDGVRAHGGLAWFPLLGELDEAMSWRPNASYKERKLTVKRPDPYRQLGLDRGVPIYEQYIADPDRFLFVPEPHRCSAAWEQFVP
jgi:glucose-6-phosphate isomerase